MTLTTDKMTTATEPMETEMRAMNDVAPTDVIRHG
jgi:hypothetical protein